MTAKYTSRVYRYRQYNIFQLYCESQKNLIWLYLISPLFIRDSGVEKQEAQRATYRAPENNVPPFLRIGQGGNLVFPIGLKNTNLVEDVVILLPVKFRWIPFSGFRGEVENVSANQRPGRPSCFSDRPEKHKPGRGRWDLASCQVSLNSVQWFQRRSRNVSANQRPGRPYCFSDRPEKHKLGRGRCDLASCQILLNSVQRFQRRSWKCLSQSEARAAILFFRSAQKHKLGRGRWDLASCQVSLNSVQWFQRRSRNVSANQRPGRPYCFSDRPEKHKLGRGRWDLASCQV